MIKQLYYVCQNLIRGRGSNLIKIVSLAMGLGASILLFARVAFELSFDKFYKDVDRLCIMYEEYTIDGKTNSFPVIMGKYPQAFAETFPKEIESATLVSDWNGKAFFNGDVRFTPGSIMADSAFFHTLGIEVVSGDPRELGNPDVVFLAKSFAKQVFGGENPIGKILSYNREIPFIVRGIYEDIPENSTLQHEVVISMPTAMAHGWFELAWNHGDSFLGYVRLRAEGSIDRINPYVKSRIVDVHVPYREGGASYNFFLKPLKGFYSGQDEVRRMVLIMSTLALAILFIVSLNYVLISVSSLSRRAKAVGVHKCNGASSTTIFSMFMGETAFIIIIALLLISFLFVNFDDAIEDLVSASLGSLFTWNTLWVPALATLLLYVIAGVLPGWLFSRIPVTQVFHRYTEGKRGWKRPLLFIQFAGTSFIFGLLCVVLMQYYYVLDQPLGYDPVNVATAQYSPINYNDSTDTENFRDNLRNLPMVEDVATSTYSVLSNYSGGPIHGSNGQDLFTARFCGADLHYPEMMRMDFVAGKTFDREMQTIVNEEFVRRMKWTPESAIGRKVEEQSPIIIVGVVADYSISSFYQGISPVILISQRHPQNLWHVRLKEPFDENIKALNEKMKEIYPTKDIIFSSLPKAIVNQYQGARRFRDAIILSSITILFVTLMGLIGYTNDEVRRRSKEIAIRKVNGAEALNVLRLLSRDAFAMALPAAVIGAVASYFISRQWLDQFAEQIFLNPAIYLGVTILTIVLVVGCVVVKSWRIANENPVNSIKSE